MLHYFESLCLVPVLAGRSESSHGAEDAVAGEPAGDVRLQTNMIASNEADRIVLSVTFAGTSYRRSAGAVS